MYWNMCLLSIVMAHASAQSPPVNVVWLIMDMFFFLYTSGKVQKLFWLLIFICMLSLHWIILKSTFLHLDVMWPNECCELLWQFDTPWIFCVGMGTLTIHSTIGLDRNEYITRNADIFKLIVLVHTIVWSCQGLYLYIGILLIVIYCKFAGTNSSDKLLSMSVHVQCTCLKRGYSRNFSYMHAFILQYLQYFSPCHNAFRS